jgi:hypothetical protein
LTTTTSSILKRNQLPIHEIVTQVPTVPLRESRLTNPYGVLDPRKAAMFLVWLNGQRGWVAPRPVTAYMRETKELLRDFDQETVEKGMLEAARVAKHPWGVNFVRMMCDGGKR